MPTPPFVGAPARALAAAVLFLCLAPLSRASAADNNDKDDNNPATLASIPIRELTVFKDGHAFVLHRGVVPTTGPDKHSIRLDHLPTPIMGAFWPYSADPDARLVSVVAGRRPVAVKRTAISIRELLEGNVGAKVTIREEHKIYEATIVGVPSRSAEAPPADHAPQWINGRYISTPEPLAPGAREHGDIILLRTDSGVRATPLQSILDVTLPESHSDSFTRDELRGVLTLNLDWGAATPRDTADVGLVYVQKGVRWIPSYKVEIDGAGRAVVRLQATLLNEMADFEDAAVHLVVGAPSFLFEDTLDPIALQNTAAALSPYFTKASQTVGAFSNAVMTQTARMGDFSAGSVGPSPEGAGPDIAGAGASEDLFIFTVENLSLRKGERMTLSVAEFPLAYTDVYTLDLPLAPPVDARQGWSQQQNSELARLLGAPKVKHKIRMTNTSAFPLTTAPALIVQGGRALAQGLMTYTAVGASLDLELTAAVDVQVDRNDTEIARVPNALHWQGNTYAHVKLAGSITLTNRRNKPVELEVVRFVLGEPTAASHDGVAAKISAFHDGRFLSDSQPAPWSAWWSWPGWWTSLNGVGRISWEVTLDPGEAIELTSENQYFWR